MAACCEAKPPLAPRGQLSRPSLDKIIWHLVRQSPANGCNLEPIPSIELPVFDLCPLKLTCGDTHDAYRLLNFS
jgi:hypothetical protein